MALPLRKFICHTFWTGKNQKLVTNRWVLNGMPMSGDVAVRWFVRSLWMCEGNSQDISHFRRMIILNLSRFILCHCAQLWIMTDNKCSSGESSLKLFSSANRIFILNANKFTFKLSKINIFCYIHRANSPIIILLTVFMWNKQNRTMWFPVNTFIDYNAYPTSNYLSLFTHLGFN